MSEVESATALAAAIRRGERSAREVLETHLERVARLDGPIGAVVTLAAERARAEAAAADERLAAGAEVGPLHGVPMTVKDSFSTAGIRTTAGSPELADHVPAADAVAVARLREAGAIVFGKTNLPIHAGDFQSFNALFGTTVNPHDPDRTPGGSSGGAAAALACGMTPLELGSDIGGSIRIPASWTGVFGHKPSYGLVPLRGHVPGPPGTRAEPDLAVAGPMARTARDLRVALDVLAGPSRRDAVAWRLDLPPPRGRGFGELRVAVWLEDLDGPVAPEIRGVVRALADRIADAGAKVEEDRPVGRLGGMLDVYRTLLTPITVSGLSRRRFAELVALAEEPPDTWTGRTARHGTVRHREWLMADERRARFRETFAEFFDRWDVLLCPAAPVPAIPHDQGPWDERRVVVGAEEHPYDVLLAWSAPATVAAAPATVVPAGRAAGGLPVGVQIVGPRLEDRTPLEVARLLEEELGLGALPVPDTTSVDSPSPNEEGS